jgi:hypothetical protein
MSSDELSRSQTLALAVDGAAGQRGKALAQVVGNENARTLNEMVLSQLRDDKGGGITALGAGLVGTLSDEARAVIEREMSIAAQQFAKQRPHLLKRGGIAGDLPDDIVARFTEAATIRMDAGVIGREMEKHLPRERLIEVVPSARIEQVPKRRKSAKRKPRRRASAPELIVKRALRRHRKAARALLVELDLTTELKELTDLEAELNKGTVQACKHASYRARNLIEGLADCLFPPSSKTRKGRDGKKHALGSKDFKNRLIAYVEDRLNGDWEGHDFRAFVATLDTVMRWTGSGPHGVYDPHEAEHMYPRLLDALAVLARAHGSD